MGHPRHRTVREDRGAFYHCVSRCVRRERLLDCPGRIALLERRIAFLSSVFTVDVVELMPMGNHVHLVVRTHPELAWCLDDEEVVRRWSLLALAGRDGTEVPESWRPSESEVRRAASDAPRVAVLRRRLASLSWHHAGWKEWTAKLWNREDRVTGHFWEGRYRATVALDDAAVLSQSVYVLLNAVHAGLEPGLGTRPAGSLRTRLERTRERLRNLPRPARLEGFETTFRHASWTPVYPCDPGSAADLTDEEFAERVARGRHRASFREAVRAEAAALGAFADEGGEEEVEERARSWEGVVVRGEAGHARAEAPRPRPRREPRHRRSPERAKAAWGRGRPPVELRRDERSWLTALENPFARRRCGPGGVTVLDGMTLGALVSLADREGRHPRPDKPAWIAATEPAAMGRFAAWVVDGEGEDDDEGEGEGNEKRRASSRARGAVVSQQADLRSLPSRAGAAAREALARAARLRSRIAELVSGRAEGPARRVTRRIEQRGSAAGSEESLAEEAVRRAAMRVHGVSPVLRE